MDAATQQVRELYNSLEVDFSPLKLCRRVEKIVKHVEEADELSALVQYMPAVKEVTLVRLLKQVSQVRRGNRFHSGNCE